MQRVAVAVVAVQQCRGAYSGCSGSTTVQALTDVVGVRLRGVVETPSRAHMGAGQGLASLLAWPLGLLPRPAPLAAPSISCHAQHPHITVVHMRLW